MLICIINPNTTKNMTNKIDVVAKKVASSGTTIISTNPKSGPESIEGYYDEVFCIPCLLYTSPSPRDRTRSRMPSSA